jgi:phage terminase small subunit
MATTSEPDGLNDQQRRFCVEYLKDLNATKAYIRAGYSANGAASSASTLLTNPKVRQEIDTLESKRISAADVTAVAVLRQLMRIAESDPATFFDEHGNLKMPHEWTPDQGAALAGFEVIKKNAEAGDGKIDTVHKVKLVDKTKALDILSKHLGLLIDKTEHSGTIVVKWQD